MSNSGSDTSESSTFEHAPVLVDALVELSASLPAGTFLDGTIGGAGHSKALLDVRNDITILGLDQDPMALRAADSYLTPHDGRFVLHRCRFDQLAEAMEETKTDQLVGFLFDLGVSSPQLDIAERGFSFRHDGPLDMRMDTDAVLTAATVVNEYSHQDLARVLHMYGDERHNQRIATAILAARPIRTTTELASVVVEAIPAAARRTGGHPAKRSFQALRIEVNNELAILAPTLELALDALVPGGRGFVLTYHSGEDRIVKDVFRQRTASIDPPHLPVERHQPDFQLLRPIARKATQEEIERNRRARSARLRSIERVAA